MSKRLIGQEENLSGEKIYVAILGWTRPSAQNKGRPERLVHFQVSVSCSISRTIIECIAREWKGMTP
jgi:hypothetical protein